MIYPILGSISQHKESVPSTTPQLSSPKECTKPRVLFLKDYILLSPCLKAHTYYCNTLSRFEYLRVAFQPPECHLPAPRVSPCLSRRVIKLPRVRSRRLVSRLGIQRSEYVRVALLSSWDPAPGASLDFSCAYPSLRASKDFFRSISRDRILRQSSVSRALNVLNFFRSLSLIVKCSIHKFFCSQLHCWSRTQFVRFVVLIMKCSITMCRGLIHHGPLWHMWLRCISGLTLNKSKSSIFPLEISHISYQWSGRFNLSGPSGPIVILGVDLPGINVHSYHPPSQPEPFQAAGQNGCCFSISCRNLSSTVSNFSTRWSI